MKKFFPIIFIFFVWLIFSKPFFIDNKIPYPTNYQLNNLSYWNNYEKYLGPVKNDSMPDVVTQMMPWKKFTINSWKNLTIPLWNPYSFSGNPHLANYQSGVFSITNLLFIFNFNFSWGLSILFQPLLAGIFTYLFLKSLKISEEGSLLGSLSFMFSGFIVTWMSWGTLSLAISFLPLALFAIEKYFEKDSLRYLTILYFSIPLSFFSGHFQISIYLLGFIILYIFFKFYETKNKKNTINALFTTALGLISSTVQLLPSLELYQNAPRSIIFQKINPIPIKQLFTIFSPDYFGNPVTRNNFSGHYIEWAMYTGLIPFIISLFSFFNRSKKIYFFILTSIISLALSLDTPVLDLLVNLKIPVISTSSLSRILCIFCFSIACLSALSIDQLKKNLQKKQIKKIISWLTLGLLIFLSSWFLILFKFLDFQTIETAKRNMLLPSIMFFTLYFFVFCSIFKEKLIKILFIIILLITSFEMLRFAIKWQPFESRELAYVETPIIKEIKKLDEEYRVYTPFGEEGSVYFGIPSSEGYDPLYIKRYGEFVKSIQNGNIYDADRLGAYLPREGKYLPKAFDFLGIKYLIQKKSDEGKSWAFPFNLFPKNKFKLIYEDKKFEIFENKTVYPKAYLVGDYFVENENQKIIDKITNYNLDLRKSVILEKDPNINKNKKITGEVKIISNTPNKIVIESNSDNEGLIIISDNFYPGWSAKINGNKKEIFRANYSFRAIPVTSGNNLIEMTYFPNSLKYGIITTAISIVIFAFFLIRLKLLKGKW